MMPSDCVRALELRPRAVKRVRFSQLTPPPMPALLLLGRPTGRRRRGRKRRQCVWCASDEARCFQIMRAAVDEIVNQGSERGACQTGEKSADSHPAGASRMTPPATRPRASEQVLPSAQSAVAEVNSGRAQARFCIEDEACFVMARACELFAMDLARRGELVVQDCRSEAKGPSQAAVTAKLKERHIVAAIECTDYCDFLVDLFHDAER